MLGIDGDKPISIVEQQLYLRNDNVLGELINICTVFTADVLKIPATTVSSLSETISLVYCIVEEFITADCVSNSCVP